MKNLQELCVCGDSGINQESIKKLNLIKLVANNNKQIIDVSFMKQLKILHAIGYCGISQRGITVRVVLYYENLRFSNTHQRCALHFVKELKFLVPINYHSV